MTRTTPRARAARAVSASRAEAAAAFRETQVEHYELAGVGGFGTVPYISHDEPGGPATSPATWYVGIVPPLRSTLLLPKTLRYEEFIHSSDTEPESPCASSASARTLDSMWDVREGQWAESFGGAGCHYVGGEVGDDWVSFPAGSSHTASDSCSGTGKQGNITGKATLSGSVTFSSPGVGGGGSPGGGQGQPPRYGPEFPTAKQEALRDLREEAIPNAMRYCIPTAVALAGGAAGVLTLGLGSAGGILAVAGSITGLDARAVLQRHGQAPRDRLQGLQRPAAREHPRARQAGSGTPPANSPRARPTPNLSRPSATRCAQPTRLCSPRRRRRRPSLCDRTDRQPRARRAQRTQQRRGRRPGREPAHAQTRTQSRRRRRAPRRRSRWRACWRSAHIGLRLSRRQSALVIAQAVRLARSQGVTRANCARSTARALKPAPANLLADLSRL